MLVDRSGIPRRATGTEFAQGPPDLSYWAATHLPVTECHRTGSYLVVRVPSSGPSQAVGVQSSGGLRGYQRR